MEDVLKSHGRKGGGYKQRESAEKMRKLQDTQTSGVAQYLVLILKPIDAPPKKNKGMSSDRSLRPLGFV